MRRCLAFPDDLDAGAPLRSREHLDILSADTNYGIMWDQYGVAGDTLVCVNVFPFPAHYADYLGTSPSPITFRVQTFMSCWPPTFCTSSSKGRSKIILSHG